MIIIPSVELELDSNLSLVIRNVNFIPGEPAKTTGLPEDCHPGNGPELNWKDEDVFLVHTSYVHSLVDIEGIKVRKRVKAEKEFNAPKGLADLYYELIVEAIEEM